jgi:hypothetical protein
MSLRKSLFASAVMTFVLPPVCFAQTPPPSETKPAQPPAYSNANDKDPSECGEKVQGALNEGYKVLLYRADTGRTFWVEKGKRTPIFHPNPFLPVAFTKDQIIVEVCSLKFDTAVNVTLSSIAIPEKGADIRGATPTTTTPSVTPGTTSDALQAVAAATNNAMAATLAPNPTVVSFTANTILVPSFFKGGQFTAAQIGATAEDFKRTLRAYGAEANSTLRTIMAICSDRGTTALATNISTCPSIEEQVSPQTTDQFGTTLDVYQKASTLFETIRTAAHATNNESDTGTFDNAKAQALQFSVILAALDSQIAAANLGTRIDALASTYRALAGDLTTIDTLFTADSPTGTTPAPKCPATISATPANSELQQQEYCYLTQFKVALGVPHAADLLAGVVEPSVLYKSLNALRSNLQKINQKTNQSFAELNAWYSRSNVVYTDNLTPSTTNLGLRVAINATELFVPFTLSFSAPAAASSVTAPAGHFESSTELIIQRRVNFNLVGGLLVIHVPTKTFALNQSPVTTPLVNTSFSPCANGTVTVQDVSLSATSPMPPTYYCPTVTQASAWQVAGIVGINWIPWGRNYYPRHGHFSKRPLEMFGLTVGSSVTSLGTVFGGLNIEPTFGLSIYAGVATAHSQALPNGIGSASNIYTTSTVMPISTFHAGLALGVGFDFSLFSQIFKGGSSPTAP